MSGGLGLDANATEPLRPEARAAALAALEAIHRDGRVTITARNEAQWLGEWEPSGGAPPR